MDFMSGQEIVRADISGMTNADQCVVTTSSAHGLSTHDFIRLTDLNSSIPILRGMDQLNNKKFRVIIIDTENFYIEDPITFEKINSTGYTPYVTGGYCTLVQPDFIYSGD